MIDDCIFFTLDPEASGRLHARAGTTWSARVVVESSQSCYVWRALCMTPVQTW